MLGTSYVDIDGAQMHVVSGGQGRPVLFLHGIPEFWYAWRAQLAELARSHRVIAADLPGCNRSSPLPRPDDYALGPIADRIAALIRRVAPGERVALVGHDVGGVIGWEVASRHEGLISKLVAINAPPASVMARQLARDPEQQRASAYMQLFEQPGAETVLAARGFEQLQSRVFGTARSPQVFTAEDRRAYIASWSRPGALTGALSYHRAFDRASQERPPVRVPTLLLWGDDDPFLLPGCLDGIEAAATDLRVRRVPGATHWIVREEPALVNAEIRAFLEGGAPELDFARVRFDLFAQRELWRRHPEYSCFWSSPDNPRGLQLTPTVEAGRVWLRLHIEREHSGFIGIAHGGVTFTILDGMMGWLIMSHLGRAGVTTSATVKYTAPLHVGREYEFEATAMPGEPQSERRIAVRARAFPVGRPAETCVEIVAEFSLLTREAAEVLLARELDSSELPFFPPARASVRPKE